ncbi:MAG: response regulator transcription factor [Chloroflexi bacterium]|nr:response regulator transcription factor [Chloroflexota bacterium]
MKRILIIDDNETLHHMIKFYFEPRGFQVLAATCGQEGIKIAYATHPDLIILDIMMPEMDGWQTCQRLREISDIPIIMLTAKVEGDDVIRGFLMGVDDYVKKPFGLKELEMRIHAVLRRTGTEKRIPNVLYDDGMLRISLQQQQVLRQGQVIHLTSTEFRLLSYLVQHKNRIVPHRELLAEVWGPTYQDAKDGLSLYIHYLREKLEEEPGAPQYIRTKWGIGYWFEPTEGAFVRKNIQA